MDETIHKLISDKAELSTLIRVRADLEVMYAEMLLLYKSKAVEMGEDIETPEMRRTCELWAATAALDHLAAQLTTAIDVGIATLQSMNETRH